ncbi:MAG: hypothetical protein M5U14_04325 [Acidimicrobiia bacterium]|nr:hypothetical protein [Acidimicrobiia bacterium]
MKNTGGVDVPDTTAICRSWFPTISSLASGSCSLIAAIAPSIPSRIRAVSSTPRRVFIGNKKKPSSPASANPWIPVPGRPQFAVNPNSKHMDRSIRSPW